MSELPPDPPTLDALLGRIRELETRLAAQDREIKKLRGEQAEKTYAPDVAAPIDRVLDRWKERTGNKRVTAAMRRTVHARLQEGYAEDELLAIADWVATSAFHNKAENQHKKYYNQVSRLYGKDSILKYLDYARAAKATSVSRDPRLNVAKPGEHVTQRTF